MAAVHAAGTVRRDVARAAMSETVSKSLPQLLVRRWPERRPVVIAGAVVLFVAVFATQRLVNDAAAGIGVLAVLPIILAGLELGLTGGLVAAAAATAALLVNAGADRPDLDAVAVVTRATMFLAVGAVAGLFSDRMRTAVAREHRLLRSSLSLSRIAADRPLAVVVAEAARAMPGVTGALVTLDGSSSARAGHREPTPVVTPIVARGAELGWIETAHLRPPTKEDVNELRLLAEQAATATEGRRLLTLEREQAAVRLELQRVRDELLGSRTGTGEVLRAQEVERGRVADELQEDLAQVLSAVLIGLRLLERGDEEGRAIAASDVRAQVTGVLKQMRSLAGTLQPSSLRQLGLAPALDALATTSGEQRAARVRIVGADRLPPLPEPAVHDVYRLVENLIQAAVAGRPLDVSLSADDEALLVTATGEWKPEALGIARARAGAREGTLELTHGGRTVQCILPLHDAAS
jgi:signal transduction histidine kinase